MTPTSPKCENDAGVSLLSKLKRNLNWGKARLRRDLRELFGRRTWNDATREELEARLLLADVGVDATEWLLSLLETSPVGPEAEPDAALRVIEQGILDLLRSVEQTLTIPQTPKPFVILVVGVNGTGKTTTIGKLARRLREKHLSILLAAGDTFRAAAVEQLSEWCERTGARLVAQAQGADPAAVIFDAVTSARAHDIDVVIADTAGRLHTSDGLMNELKKIKRVMGKIDATYPHETLLVLDASQGQNALVQATKFHEVLELSGLIVTKLDGTAKGGILLAIARQLGLPIRFVGTGEGAEDLRPFDAQGFTEALLGDDER